MPQGRKALRLGLAGMVVVPGLKPGPIQSLVPSCIQAGPSQGIGTLFDLVFSLGLSKA